ncbi:MAG: hypothetical protein HQL80_03345 [Magnetococcales bacterium]|nr:hypothetical protein [Magnetococcales bacterium]
MIETFLGLLFITGLLWVLLRLRHMRESELEDELPSDKITVLIGLYLLLSKACLRYYRDHGQYPEHITGDSDSLLEAGYLKGEPLVEMTRSLPLFSIAVADTMGSAICLANTKKALATELITRLQEMGSPLVFIDLRTGQFITLSLPIAHDMVNLCLMLPRDPLQNKGKESEESRKV